MNPSLIIFNNTILGTPFEELQLIIDYVRSHAQPHGFHHGEDFGGHQIILVDRSTDDEDENEYKKKFQAHSFLEIFCGN